MFGSIKTTLFETFDEHYVTVSGVAAAESLAAVRPHVGDSLWYQGVHQHEATQV